MPNSIKKTDDLSPIDLNSTDVVAKKNEKVTVDIVNTISSEVTGKSTLHRNENGITINFKTTGLIPGHAYTLWWGVWNKPENCGIPGECVESDLANAVNVEVQLLYAGGHVSGGNGYGNFSAHLKENDDSGSIHELFGLPNFGGLQNAETAEIHAEITDKVIDIIVRNTENISPYSLVLFNVMKGAVTRVEPEETPFPYRGKQWYFDITPQWQDPKEADSLIAWTKAFWAEVEPHTQGTAVNWLSNDDGLDRIKVAYGPNYSRLAKLKHKYDPDNFFRLNNNILPNAKG